MLGSLMSYLDVTSDTKTGSKESTAGLSGPGLAGVVSLGLLGAAAYKLTRRQTRPRSSCSAHDIVHECQYGSDCPACRLGLRLLHNNQSPSSDMIQLSIRGCVMSLDLEFVESQSWLVSNILTSSIPFNKVEGAYFLDVDPHSFRLIVAILKGIVLPEFDRMPSVDLLLLKSTAEYLLCDRVVREVEWHLQEQTTRLQDCQNQIREKDALIHVINANKQKEIKKKDSIIQSINAQKQNEIQKREAIIQQLSAQKQAVFQKQESKSRKFQKKLQQKLNDIAESNAKIQAMETELKRKQKAELKKDVTLKALQTKLAQHEASQKDNETTPIQMKLILERVEEIEALEAILKQSEMKDAVAQSKHNKLVQERCMQIQALKATLKQDGEIVPKAKLMQQKMEVQTLEAKLSQLKQQHAESRELYKIRMQADTKKIKRRKAKLRKILRKQAKAGEQVAT